ncbi:MAG: polyribonucleotide nucleotidyltransferase, partial [Chlamydiia bacterium]|nr:polyribonucleotide nucleotidyltransferase [Chlamydiia bacterium]
MSTPHKKTIDLGTHQLKFESGKIARQADGAVLLSVNDTLILGTACTTPDPLEDVDFVPLRVDYIEKFSSAGKTVGGFFKREGRPTQREVLTCRLIDRPIRPLILEGYTHDTQIITQVLSYDETYSTEPFAICAASAALALSSVPLVHPVGAVRVGYIDGQFVVNPTLVEQKKSTLDLMLAGTEEAILMIEGFCELLTEAQVLEAIAVGHKAIQLICRGISEWQREIGKPKNLETLKRIPEELLSCLRSEFNDELKSALKI